MSDLGLTRTAATPRPTSAGAGPLPATASALADVVGGQAGLPVGAIVQGTVAGRDGKGHLVIRTPNGTLALSTNLALAPGNAVTLQIQSNGTQARVIILAVNGQPLAAAGASAAQAAANAQSAGDGPPAGTLGPANSSNAAQQGPNVAARLATPSSQSAPPALPPPVVAGLIPGRVNAPSGTAPSAADPAARAPSSGQPATSKADPLQTESAKSPDAKSPTAQSESSRAMLAETELAETELPKAAVAPVGPAPSSAKPNTAITVRIMPGLTPEAAMVELEAAAGGRPVDAQLLSGRVIATDRGVIAIETPIGILQIASRDLGPAWLARLPAAGERIVIDIMGVEARLTPPAPPASEGPGRLVASGDWPSLRDAADALRNAQPEAAAQLLARLPSPGPGMTAALVAFIQAIDSGLPRRWLGEEIARDLDRLEFGKLAARLEGDFAGLARAAARFDGDWRSTLIPFAFGQRIEFLRLHRRGGRQKGSREESAGGTRFLLDLELTRLGSMQFDGLVRRRRFDLIVRSRAPMAASMRYDIDRLFYEAAETTGFAGTIGFQGGEHFVRLPASAQAPAAQIVT